MVMKARNNVQKISYFFPGGKGGGINSFIGTLFWAVSGKIREDDTM